MPFQSHTTDPEVMSEINTTPLIDVMLVLLIMLIITIPVQLHAVNMKLPTTTAATPEPAPVIKLDIHRDGTVRWEDEPLTDQAALEEKLATAAQLNPLPELHLRTHPQAPYRHVAMVLAAAQRHGLRQLAVTGSSNLPTH